MKKRTKPTKVEKKNDADDIVFRVWRLTPEARAALASIRGTRGCENNQLAIDAAVASILPRITETLLSIGAASLVQKQKTYRLPMSPFTLAALKDASEQTGVPVSHLLLLSINGLTNGKPTPTRKSRKGGR